MMHIRRSRRFATASMFVLLAALGCGDSAHTPAVDESLAGRLVGTWDLTLSLERPLSLATDARTLPRRVTGTVALLDAGKEHLSFEGIGAPTHVGVFHVDLGALGFPSRGADGVPDLAARVVAAPRRDSVYILFNPETPRYALQLSGTFDATTASGTWSAESFLGGGGTFVMRRR
jgi:hypothetical protein